MQFLSASSAIVALALSVPALLVLYLLKLRRRPLRVTSTMLWESATKDLQANEPLRWLKPSLLFLLHLAILGLLAGALGRPVARGGGGDLHRVVLLLDRSASMGATDMEDGSTRLDAAKKRASALVDSWRGSGREMALVTFASDAAAITRFTASPGLIRDALREVRVTDQPADLERALELVRALAGRTAEDSGGPTPLSVVLLSDGSFETQDPLSLPGVQLRFEPVTPRENATDNVAIVHASARRDPKDPAVVRVFGRLAGTLPEPVSVPVTLSLDGVALQRRVVEVPERGKSVGVVFEAPISGGGVATLSLGREDDLRCDDLAALVLAPPRKPSVLLVRGDRPGAKAEDDGDAAPWVLQDVLEEMGLASLRVVSTSSAENLTLDSGEKLDLLIFDGVAPSTPPAIPTICFGQSPSIPGLKATESTGPPVGVVLWDRAHPLLRAVTLDGVIATRTLKFSLDRTLLPQGWSFAELVQGPDAPLMLFAESKGVGHVLVGFSPADSNWPLQFSFPVFLANAVDALTLRAEGDIGRSVTTTQAARIRASGGPGAVVFKGPTGSGSDREIEGEPLDGWLSVGVLEHAGVYTTDSPRAQDKVVAVNLFHEHESALGIEKSIDVAGGAFRTPIGEGTRELWMYFILAAAALLVVEWILFGVRMRV